jgi:hypothetical protein
MENPTMTCADNFYIFNKGDRPRPILDRERFNRNFDEIFRKKPGKEKKIKPNKEKK